ncbi:bifunctional phosphopantothenoylcysteine decarboxylase/phosphopantothenate--cysteine ligase CoaBC [Teredinibacter sp. KSP-S5-2]|uniref:bifunctional phosphopantothenoylcysteine decarboxylase/phosphopantothenate--cysteine ligase CoaBC n=1 Tax=Teredinibacter sp. KSP-S5-2 TaxID=3034506 RepID=UPI0029345099|nr:bifunctional phosphopantothenoylcysteine decarboxylase/phosphopantothenate--cysteine ligase CoaBC [Teredinibacter sp. KSP-S5-2]WNO09313.1 bifunctional phosphopantothenoylcysteine decarboxylase/phosphopantothenate--cysteine ligase CoaBC [Teredinibacter sp. KSP-S5-2]
MSSLTNKNVLLGVTGGIAAYKSAELIRRLSELGADVRVVMTRAAQEFITPLTMQALSGNPVHTDLLDVAAEAAMGHIQLARWADIIIIAPCTADFIAKLATGEGSDLLSTVCLAAKSDLAIAPAMNQAMWGHQATQANLAQLIDRGVKVWGPASGEQACGDVGLGRMLEPSEIASCAEACFDSGVLAGKKVVLTAGPTREAIDPVRYISNHSSGKMGYALARAAAEAGAQTILISGPTNLPPPADVEFIAVESAEQMNAAVMARIENAQVFIGAAAVADYRPVQCAAAKLKKTASETMSIELTKNPDIIAGVAETNQVACVIGFAAETDNLLEYARAKRVNKKLDMVIANDVSQPGIGFNSDNNNVTVIDANGETEIAGLSKYQLAKQLIQLIAQKI